MLKNAPDAPDQQLADALFEATGVRIHRSTVNDYWHRWGYTRKKSRLYPPKDKPTASKP
jgi:transposase